MASITRLPDEKQISGFPARWELFYRGCDLTGTGPIAWNGFDNAKTEEEAIAKAERALKEFNNRDIAYSWRF